MVGLILKSDLPTENFFFLETKYGVLINLQLKN